MVRTIFPITKDEYQEAVDSCSGICMACGEMRWSDTEPDAEEYPCDACGQNKVMGIENALLAGMIEFTDEE